MGAVISTRGKGAFEICVLTRVSTSIFCSASLSLPFIYLPPTVAFAPSLLYAAILSRAQQPLSTKGICPLLSPCKVLSSDTHLICSPMSSGAWFRLKPFLATCVMWPTLPCHPRSTLPKAFPIGCFIVATHSSNCLAYRVFILQTTLTPTDCMESWGCLFCSLLHPRH